MAEGTILTAVDSAVALARAIADAVRTPEAASVVATTESHLERWGQEFRPATTETARSIQAAPIGALLAEAIERPDRAAPSTATAAAGVDALSETLHSTASGLGAWADDLLADARGVADVKSTLEARVNAEAAQIDSLRAQIADLERQVADAEERRRTEIESVGWLFGLGYLIAALDDAIDNLVNQTDEKRRLAEQLRGTVATEEAELAELVSAQSALVQMFDAGSAVAATVGSLVLQTDAVESSLNEAREMIDDADQLEPLLRAAADEWATLTQAATRLAA